MWGWFDTREVRQFAGAVAEEYVRLRKSSALRMDDASKRAKKTEKLVKEVRQFNRDKGLNIYKKAKMLREIGNCLHARGIPEPDAAAFVDSLLLTDLPRR